MKPLGTESEIPQALWQRHQTYGVVHQLFVSWVAGSLLVVGLAYDAWGWAGVLGAVLVCGAALLGLQWLTRQDPQWDEALANDLGRRYQQYYDAE